jgi:hypothetical protein
VKVVPYFRWYDLWIGVYVDAKSRHVYVQPFFMIGVRLELGR